jgi:hypothetical protein
VLETQSTTPEYLDRQRKQIKRTRIFGDATYAGKPLRAQPLTQDVIEDLGGHEMMTTQTWALVDWVDLDTEQADGDVLTYTKRGNSYEVVSVQVARRRVCRLVLRNP